MMAAVARGCLCLFVLLSVRSGGMLRRLDDYYVNWQKNADEPYPSTVRVANDTAHTHTHIERWIPHDAHMCRKKKQRSHRMRILGGARGRGPVYFR